MAEKQIRVTLLRSLYGRLPGHRESAHGIGLRRRHQSVTIKDTPENRGMINKVSYLLKVEEA
ncbi:MAG: 50S ribosomal protein L30 [Chromatiales bacterium 21-64-14]|nr:MAG: 50S ribosomal protein L30 [Chromatiales bacterium 21-64-14]HQU14993.1 50S ribosomal protein L30 [Gammaproteobacteria bacterium]